MFHIVFNISEFTLLIIVIWKKWKIMNSSFLPFHLELCLKLYQLTIKGFECQITTFLIFPVCIFLSILFKMRKGCLTKYYPFKLYRFIYLFIYLFIFEKKNIFTILKLRDVHSDGSHKLFIFITVNRRLMKTLSIQKTQKNKSYTFYKNKK